MDWQVTLRQLISEAENNLRPLRRHGQVLTAKKSLPGVGSYALLREGVSPGDPHLIAPAIPGGCGWDVLGTSGTCTAGAPGLIAAARPLAPLPAAAACDNGRPDRLRQELAGLSEQLTAAASGWKGVAAAVASVQSVTATQAGQLAGLASGVADLKAANGRLEQAAEQRRARVQGQLAQLGSRMDALAARPASGDSQGGIPSSEAPALRPLAERLGQTEVAVAELQARFQRAAELADAGPAAPAAPAVALAELAAVQAGLQSLQAAHGCADEQSQAQQAELQRLSERLHAEVADRQAAQQAAAAQTAALGEQLSQLQALQVQAARSGDGDPGSALLGGKVDELAAQVAAVLDKQGARHQEQQRVLALLAEQEQELRGLQEQSRADAATTSAAAATGREELAQLGRQVAAGSGALLDLQQKVAQLGGVQAAVDDANQRLFELRVEVQNGAEDGAIAAASLKRQAEAAEQHAEAASDAVAEMRQLAGTLQAELAQVQHQVAAVQQAGAGGTSAGDGTQGWHTQAGQAPAQLAELIQHQVAASVAAARDELAASVGRSAAEQAAAAAAATQEAATAAQQGSVASLSETVDRVAAELAGVKLLLAQQQEAADADARARSDALHDRCVRAALSAVEQLVQQHSPSGLATVAETAACLTTLTDIVHQQRAELAQVKQGLAAAQEAAAAASAGGAAAGHADTGQQGSAEQVQALAAALRELQQQLAGAAAAAEQRQAAQGAELAALRCQLAGVQRDAAVDAGALRQDVAAMQRHLAVVEESSEGGLGDQPVRPQLDGLAAHVAGLDSALVAQQAQQGAGLAALQQQLQAVQRQLAAAGGQQPGAVPAMLEEARQDVDARVQRTEATVASALEEVAAQMAALAGRVDAAEAAAAAAAAAAAEGQLQSYGVHAARLASEDTEGQLSVVAGNTARKTVPRPSSSAFRQVEGPPAGYADRHLQRQRSRSPAQHVQQAQQEGSVPRRSSTGGSGSSRPASASGSTGLFARLSRSLSGHGRRTSGAQEAPPAAPAALLATRIPAPPPAAPSSAATGRRSSQGVEDNGVWRQPSSGREGIVEVGWERSHGGDEVPLRVRYSSSNGSEQEAQLAQQAQHAQQAQQGLHEEGSSGSQGSGGGPSERAPARSRTTSTGSAGGGFTPRSAGSGGLGRYTPRSRQWASLQRELSRGGGEGSGASTPRQAPTAFSSFGEVPLPMSASSCLPSPRDAVDARLEAELAGTGLVGS